MLARTKSFEEFRREADQTKTKTNFASLFDGWHAKATVHSHNCPVDMAERMPGAVQTADQVLIEPTVLLTSPH